MNRSLIPIFFAIICLLIAIGCSGSSTDPVAPSSGNDTPELTDPTTQAAPVVDDPNYGHSLLGYYDVVVDTEEVTIEFVPMRTTEYHFNMVGILEATMNLGIAGPISIQNGVLSVDISLTHPFAGNTKLSGFDVKGVLITEGTEIGFGNPDIKIAGPLETRLVNADGFTRWWNPAEFTALGMSGYIPGHLGSTIDPANAAILNGYKLFADGLAPGDSLGDLDPSTRAFFLAGNTCVRTFDISLASGLHFNYAVDISWATPDVVPPVDLPGDFPMEANQAEPWYIEVTETNNTLWYDDGSHGGNVNYEVTVHDWQGMDDIGTLTFECPGLFTFTESDPATSTEFTGTYNFDIILPELTSALPLDVLVTVETPGDYDTALTGVNKPLRAYHRHITEVSPNDPIFNEPPTAIMEATSDVDIFSGNAISFDASASYDIDGYITDYLWDFNGDGVYGDSYDGPAATPSRTYNQTGNFTVKVKVTDNESGSGISSPVSVHVTLDTNDPPTAVAEATSSTDILEDSTVDFDGSASYDLDGTVENWEWDFDGDGTYGDAYTGDMQTPTAEFPDPGTFYVDLKVTDNEGGIGYLDDKIEVEVTDIPNVNPVAVAISTTPTDIDSCGTVTFDATGSYDTDGTIVDYQWDFDGDGTFGDTYEAGTDTNPVKTYTGEGTWDVDLKVIDDEAGESTLPTPITVTATNVDPIASAEATTSTDIYGGDTVSFDASASTDPDCHDTLVYEWDFDDDGVFGDAFDSGTTDAPTKAFAVSPGDYEVWCRVTDPLGGVDVIDTPIVITVQNTPPVACAEITSEFPYIWNTDIEISGECSADVDGTITLYEWDFNADGSYEDTGMTVTYNIDTADDYVVQLRVTDNEGDTDVLDDPIQFHIYDDSNIPPVVNEVLHNRTTSLKGSTAEAVELSVDFTDFLPPSDTHTYLWSCDYGSFDDPTSPTPTWTPPNQVVDCDITVEVFDAMLTSDTGTTHQWVTQWPIKTTGNSPTGEIIPVTLEDILTDTNFDPSTFQADEVAPYGNVIYINFWGIGCGYCIAEMDELDEMYELYMAEDYIHIMIDVNDSEASVEAWLANNPDYDATHWTAQGQSNAYFWKCNDWNSDSSGIPQHVMFDRDGYCRGSRLGSIYSTGISALTQYLDEWI